MIEYITRSKLVNVPEKYICDVCHKEQVDLEIDDMLQLDFYGGYCSAFGDMNHVKCDICHKCLFNIIHNYCRINEDECIE